MDIKPHQLRQKKKRKEKTAAVNVNENRPNSSSSTTCFLLQVLNRLHTKYQEVTNGPDGAGINKTTKIFISQTVVRL